MGIDQPLARKTLPSYLFVLVMNVKLSLIILQSAADLETDNPSKAIEAYRAAVLIGGEPRVLSSDCYVCKYSLVSMKMQNKRCGLWLTILKMMANRVRA